MPYVVTPDFYEELRNYFTQTTILSINEEPEVLRTALSIADQAVRTYAENDSGLPYTELVDDMAWARLAAMQRETSLNLRKEFWPQWSVNPLETASDVLVQQLIERDLCMIYWDKIAQHFLHLTLTEIAHMVKSSHAEVTIPVVNVQPFTQATASSEDAPPEPAMSFWV